MNKRRAFIGKCNKAAKDFFRWIWAQCKNWQTVVLLGIVSLVLYSPAIVGWVVGFMFKWNWAWVTATAYAAFWMGPFSPFFAIAVTVTLSIKKIFEVVIKRKARINKESTDPTAEVPAEKMVSEGEMPDEAVTGEIETPSDGGEHGTQEI